MSRDGDSSGVRRIGARAAPAIVTLVLAACGTGTPSSSTPPATTPPSSSPPSAQESGGPTNSATTGRLPMGRVVFDRLAGSPEGDFLGAFVMGVDGAATPLQLPVSNMGFRRDLVARRHSTARQRFHGA